MVTDALSNRFRETEFMLNLKADGAGLRLAWNKSTLISFDYGLSREDKLFTSGWARCSSV